MLAPAALAQDALQHVGAQLQIEPKRVLLGPDRRGAQVALRLPWGEGEFDVRLVDRIMLPDGRILALGEAVGEPGASDAAARLRSARPFVSAVPDSVTLKAGAPAGEVRVSLGPAPGEPGEYRTHLTVTARRRPGARPEGAPAVMTWAYAVPVIVRVGPVDVRGRIENAHVETVEVNANGAVLRRRALVFDLVRAGANSLFGDLSLHARDGSVAPILAGVAVYPEAERRRIVHPLTAAADGVLELRFTDRDTNPGRVVASAWVNLAPLRSAAAPAEPEHAD